MTKKDNGSRGRPRPVVTTSTMAEYSYTPTPPTMQEGPYYDLDISSISEGDYHIITPGLNDGVPQIWAVVYIYVSVTASAVVGNRNFRVLHRGPSNDSMLYLKTDSITASQTKQGQLGPIGTVSGLGQTYGDWYWPVGPEGIVVAGQDDLMLFLSSAQSGDVSSAYLRLKYLNRLLGMPTPTNKGGPWPL